MKYKAPEDVTSISVGGECFNVGSDGCVEVPDEGEYGQLLAPHGFVPVPEKQPRAAKPAKQADTAATSADDQKTAGAQG